MKKSYLTIAAVAIALGTCGQSNAASLITNGSFETGDLTGWTSQGWAVGSIFTGFAKSASDGFFYATTGCVGDACINGTVDEQAYLFQDIPTIPGEKYTLSFDFQSDEDPTELKVLFGGNTAFDLSGIGFQLAATTYTETFTASGTTTRLTFLGRDDPAFPVLDNIGLVDTGVNTVVIPDPPPVTGGAAPEPSTWVLAFGGVVAAYRFRRR